MSATDSTTVFAEGGCACKKVRFQMLKPPLFVHCCHCLWCQRETGSAFVLNAIVEQDEVKVISENTPFCVPTPSESGSGQDIYRCPKCFVPVWSVYSNPVMRFVRVGTLDKPNLCPPSIHIYTESKQDWVDLNKADEGKEGGILIKEQFYDIPSTWPKESMERLTKLGLEARKQEVQDSKVNTTVDELENLKLDAKE